ncbi:adenosine kinase [Paracoccus alkenifer]|uniref:Sugar or nucleoside kinase, ribokinase family n=1 Tax=Paracoccus alkenifer TaxID=65735 RepID=A0A1H6L6Y2_9RHOB|nr:adenosine kinase [Paracoccus alkenifer]SEH80981.1 Sugar or nucleoside kinase, ribokinase family [Paracoccus alkenifer]
MAYRVIGIGNAVMDVIAPVTDAVLDELGIARGVMALVERDRSEQLMAAATGARLVPGGSVANTMAGLGRLGLSTACIGRVADDDLGRAYVRQTVAEGSDFVNPPVAGAGLPTSRSIIFVTPDGERSMNTWLGISAELDESDVDEALFTDGCWLFLEGYLFDKDKGKAAFHKAAQAARAAGGQAGIALSDPFCVDRHREDFRRLVAGPMDYVIGNVHEWLALYQVADLDEALRLAAADCGTVVCTRSGEDAILIRGDERAMAPVHAVTPVDATGAGDQFAAGLIHGLVTGRPLAVAGRMGCIAAAEVISHVGARPQADVLALFRAEGLV